VNRLIKIEGIKTDYTEHSKMEHPSSPPQKKEDGRKNT
jgi:hypothetical protein